MIYDLDQTLEKIIYDKGKLNRNEIDISFEQPNGEWSARLSRPTLNCWCFDLRENKKLRNSNRRIQRNETTGTVTFPPRRFDVTYLVTAWTRKIEDEHRLLWRGLSALKRTPIIYRQDAEGDLRYGEHDIPLLVATESDHPINLVDLWSVLNNEMHLGFTVVATLELDPVYEITGPLVLEGYVRVGQSLDPRTEEMTVLDVEITHRADDNAKNQGEEEPE